MKPLILLFLCLYFHFGSFAQSEVFRIDSLPKQGVLLNKGWKFHAGDNPEWAKSDFDDSEWESIDPTKEIADLPQIRKQSIGWFRIKIHIDSSLLNKPLAFQVYQSIASEIYFNGALIKKYGIVNSKKNEVTGFLPNNDLEGLLLTSNDNTLAIRFSTQPSLPYFKYTRSYKVFHFHLNNINNASLSRIANDRGDKLRGFHLGVFFLLFIIHFSYYLYYKKQKENLFFALSIFAHGLGYFISAINYFTHSLSVKAFGAMMAFPLIFSIRGVFLFLAIWYMFSRKKNFIFWFLIVYSFAGIFINILSYHWGYAWGLFIPLLLCNFESTRLTYIAYKKNEKGLIILLIGFASFLIFFIIKFFFYMGVLKPIMLTEYWSYDDILYDLSVAIVPFTLSIYLSKRFANASKDLEKQLIEVQQLSEEKQNTLLQKNAELQAAILQGQTTERRRVAIDLHDNLGSTLSSIGWSMDAIDKSKMTKSEQKIYQNLKEMILTAYNEVRLLSHNLLPEELEKQGLVSALQSFVRKLNKNTKTQFELQIPANFNRLDKRTEFELYTITLELVNNILKHSHATNASIIFEFENQHLKLNITDNGRGLFENNSDGKGLKNVQARVESLNGKWEIKSKENEGTNSIIKMPI